MGKTKHELITSTWQQSNHYQNQVTDVPDKDMCHDKTHYWRDKFRRGIEIANQDRSETEWFWQHEQSLDIVTAKLNSTCQYNHKQS